MKHVIDTHYFGTLIVALLMFASLLGVHVGTDFKHQEISVMLTAVFGAILGFLQQRLKDTPKATDKEIG